GCCFWLAFPLLYDAWPNSIPARSLTAAFPWLFHLFWTKQMPFFVSALGSISWLNLSSGSAQVANLLLILLSLAFLLFFLAAGVCQRAIRDRLGRVPARWLLALICLFTFFFGGLFVFLPGGASQDALLFALYGRLISVYHVNPYLASPGVVAY